jgi:hypothetical protein
MGPVKPTRASILAALAIGIGVLSWLVVRGHYSSMPALPVVPPVTLVVLAVFEVLYAFSLRSRMRNPGNRQLDLLFVAKMAVLAKASSHTAAIVAGVYGGFLVYTLANLGKPGVNSDSRASGLSVVASLALIGAGLFLEYSCRVPREPDDRD